MNKFLKVVLEVILSLTILALVIVFLIFTAKSEIVPDIYVTSDSGKVAKAIRGGYIWNSFSDSVVADAIAPADYVYTNENTLLVTPGEKMTFKNSDNPMNCYKFYQLEMKYYDDSNVEVIVPTAESSKVYADLKYLELNAPEAEGTYIYNFKFSYYNNGEVDYGLKVVVSTEPNYEIDELIKLKNTNITDYERINSIIETLPYSNYKESIILKTNSQERELVINCTELIMDRKDLKNNVIALFTLIPDIKIITYKTTSEENVEQYTFTKTEIENQLGRSLVDYSNDIDLWKKDILFKEKVIDELVNKDLIYKQILEDMFIEYSEEVISNIFIDSESFKNTNVLSITDVDRQEIMDYISKYSNIIYDMNYEQYIKTRSKEIFIDLIEMRDKLTFIEEQFSGDSVNDTNIVKNQTDFESKVNSYFSGDEYEKLKNQYICSIRVCHKGSVEIYNYEVEYKDEKWNVMEI